MFRFHLVVESENDPDFTLWIVRDSQGVYRDSRPMDGGDGVVTCQWLNAAHEDGRLRTLESEYRLGEWRAAH